MAKALLILLIMALSLYPIVELTRVILEWIAVYGFELQFLFEICFMWILYLSIPFILYRFFKIKL